MEKYLSELVKMPLFENIEPEHIPAMLSCLQAQKKSFAKDTFVAREGDPAGFIGIVLSGAVQILQYDYNGNRTITASVPAGGMFAEAIACAEIPYLPFSVQAAAESEILLFDERQIVHQCDGACVFHARLIQNLLKIVSRKNMMLNRKLWYFSHKTTAEKLLSFLDDRAKENRSDEFEIPFDRQALADYLGVERSAMSAVIGQLQRQGVLETKRNRFRLLYPGKATDEC